MTALVWEEPLIAKTHDRATFGISGGASMSPPRRSRFGSPLALSKAHCIRTDSRTAGRGLCRDGQPNLTPCRGRRRV